MKKIPIVLFTIFIPYIISAQEVIASQGDTYSNSNAILTFTIGEVVINTETDGSSVVTQGFNQTNLDLVNINNLAPPDPMLVYPNPSPGQFNISYNDYEGVDYTLHDAAGRLVQNGQLLSDNHTIDISLLAKGLYTLTLFDKAITVTSQKLIKL